MAAVTERLYSLQFYHYRQKALDNATDLHRIELEAWNLLQSLVATDVEAAETKQVAELLQVFNYFTAFWEHGLDGPANSRTRQGGSKNVSGDASVPLDIPLIKRRDSAANDSGDGRGTSQYAAAVPPRVRESEAPPKRQNPLDEILEF